jgi:hypothetical protein
MPRVIEIGEIPSGFVEVCRDTFKRVLFINPQTKQIIIKSIPETYLYKDFNSAMSHFRCEFGYFYIGDNYYDIDDISERVKIIKDACDLVVSKDLLNNSAKSARMRK